MVQQEPDEVKTTEVNTTNESKSAVPAATSLVKPSRSMLGMVLLTLVFLGLLTVAFAAGKYSGNRDRDAGSVPTRTMMGRGEFGVNAGGMPGGNTRGGMMGGPNMMDPDAASNSSRVIGVVTAVDGDTLTVAGNGTTKSVKVTSDTNYAGSDKPAKVNDSIMAVGTMSDSVLTAATVRLTRQ